MKEEYYILSRTELLDLIAANLTLCGLEIGGVSSWSWYSDSINDFLKQDFGEDCDEIEDAAKIELKNYRRLDEWQQKN